MWGPASAGPYGSGVRGGPAGSGATLNGTGRIACPPLGVMLIAMRLVARFALAVTLLTAAAPLIASLLGCGGMSCCAHSETRFTLAMTCCPAPSVTSAPEASVAKQRTTVVEKTVSDLRATTTAIVAATPSTGSDFVETPSSPPTRIRLAHLATLLI
jgi:hypothetical protein